MVNFFQAFLIQSGRNSHTIYESKVKISCVLNLLMLILYLFHPSSKLKLWSFDIMEVFLSVYICLANYFHINVEQ
jgi:hypothetical protein